MRYFPFFNLKKTHIFILGCDFCPVIPVHWTHCDYKMCPLLNMYNDYNGISVIGQKPHPLCCYTYFWEKVHLIFRKLKKKKYKKNQFSLPTKHGVNGGSCLTQVHINSRTFKNSNPRLNYWIVDTTNFQ